MTSKMLYVAGMKTESVFVGIFLEFLRKCGISFVIQRDNPKSEMSQRVKFIHSDSILLTFV
jgi:hypothetical protein